MMNRVVPHRMALVFISAIALFALRGDVLAEETSIDKPICDAITSSGAIPLATELVDLALPEDTSSVAPVEPKSEVGRLSKWTVDPRILVLGDGPVQPRLIELTKAFAEELLRLGYVNTQLMVDFSGSEKPRDGDIVVALTPMLRAFQSSEAEHVYRQLVVAYGSEPALNSAIARHKKNLDDGFVDVVGDESSNAIRAVVGVNVIGPLVIRDPELYDYLTTALNPNPGNLLFADQIYRKVWKSQIDYTIRWTKKAELYLALLHDGRLRSGMRRSELLSTLEDLLMDDEVIERLRRILGC